MGYSLILLKTTSDNSKLISSKIETGWLNLLCFSSIKFCWLKPHENPENYSAINFECREINVIVLPNGQLDIRNFMLNTKYSATNIYLFKVNNRNSRKSCGICSNIFNNFFCEWSYLGSDHTHKMFISFKHTVSLFNLISTIYLISSVSCKVRVLALCTLIFTVLD